MKIWDVEVWIVSTKEDSDHWEHWSTMTVPAETIEEAIAKAVEDHYEIHEKSGMDFYKVEARKAELIREVDVP